MKKYYLLMLLFFGFQAIQAQYTQIPDPNFEQALIDYEYDDILDGKVLTANISGINYLNLYSQNISDLSGIQDFVDLETLYCYSNQLTTLDVSGLTNLNNFDCSYNQITNLNVSGLTNLQTLNCEQNQLTNLNLSGLTNLNQLYCTNNLLTNLNISGLTNLNQLYCQANQLSTLDLRGLSNLYDMYCYANPDLSCISVNNVGQANQNYSWNKDSFTTYSLDCSIPTAYTLIPDSNFEQFLIINGQDDIMDGRALTSNFVGVTYLDASNRYINDLTGIQDFVNLQTLFCHENQLTNLDVSGLTNLQFLYCTNNQLTNINVSGLTNLQSLYCTNNQLSTLDLRGLTSLSNLNSTLNPNLSCISVNNISQANQNNNLIKDSFTNYSLDCGPNPPTANAQSFCGSTTANSLVPAISSSIKWYSSSTSTTALIASDEILTGTYYVSQIVNDLEGYRAAVPITVNQSVVSPIENQVVCNNSNIDAILFNTISNVQTICGLAYEGESVTLTAPAGSVITEITFASYGAPYGSCGDFTISESCHAINSMDIVSSLAIGKNSVTIPASNDVFGNPCGEYGYTLLIQATTASVSTYNWTNDTPSIGLSESGTGSINSFIATNTSTIPVVATISVVKSDSNGCQSDPRSFTLTVNPILEPTFTQVEAICSGASIAALPTTSENGISGTWSTELNNEATTEYIFTPNEGQCATTATMTIVVNPIVEPTFTQVGAICAGETLSSLPTISDNGISGTWSPELNNEATTEYTFTPADGQCATTATMTITVNPNTSSTETVTACDSYTWLVNNQTYTESGTYNATGTNVAGCIDTKTLVLTINSSPIVDVITPPSTCEGLVQIILTNVTASEGSVSLWTATNGGTIDGGNDNPFRVNISTAGTYMLTVTNGSCVASDSVTAVYNPIVEPTFTAVAPICAGQTLAELPAISNNGIPGTWSPALNNEATTEYTFTPENGQCATTATMTITVNQCSQVFCSGATVSSLTPSGAGIVWYSTDLTKTPLLATAILSTKTYYYTQTVGGVVSSRISQAVVVNQTSNAGSITGASGTACYNSERILGLSTTSRGSVQWQSSTSITGPFTPITEANTATLNTGNLIATTYYNAVVTNGVCPSKTTATATVLVRTQSNAGTISGGGVSVCAGTNRTVLRVSGQVGTIQWQSSTDDSNFVNIPSMVTASFTALNLSTTTYYRVIVTNGLGCTPAISSSVAITVKPLPLSGTITGTSSVPYNTSANLTIIDSEPGSSLLWSYSATENGTYLIGKQLINNAVNYTSAKLTADYFYRVTVTKDGCSSKTAPFLVDVSSSVKLAANTSSTLFEVKAYPNPSSSEFTIETSAKGSMSVQVYDMAGRLVEKADTNKVGSRLAAGTYNVIVNQGANTKSVRVIKQ